YLVEDFICGGKWFDEDRACVGNRSWHFHQVFVRQAKEISERSVAPQNPEHGAPQAMTAESARAPCAFATRSVDLAHDALAGQAAASGFRHFANELVSRNAL